MAKKPKKPYKPRRSDAKRLGRKPTPIADRLISEMRVATERLNLLEGYLLSLSELDRVNFNHIVHAHNATELVAHQSKGEYRDMLLLALAVKNATHAVPITKGD